MLGNPVPVPYLACAVEFSIRFFDDALRLIFLQMIAYLTPFAVRATAQITQLT